MTKYRDYYKEPTTIIIEKSTRLRLKDFMTKSENYDKLLNRLMDYI